MLTKSRRAHSPLDSLAVAVKTEPSNDTQPNTCYYRLSPSPPPVPNASYAMNIGHIRDQYVPSAFDSNCISRTGAEGCSPISYSSSSSGSSAVNGRFFLVLLLRDLFSNNGPPYSGRTFTKRFISLRGSLRLHIGSECKSLLHCPCKATGRHDELPTTSSRTLTKPMFNLSANTGIEEHIAVCFPVLNPVTLYLTRVYPCYSLCLSGDASPKSSTTSPSASFGGYDGNNSDSLRSPVESDLMTPISVTASVNISTPATPHSLQALQWAADGAQHPHSVNHYFTGNDPYAKVGVGSY